MACRTIRDPIHGNIEIEGLFCSLLDTPQMQRLRNIKQNGLCYLVYPAMNSNRFEHSLGVYHLAGLLCSHLKLDEDDSKDVRAASLLHDIGHGPLSHTFDKLYRIHGFDHEMISKRRIKESPVADVLVENSIALDDVCDLVGGEGRLGKILSSEVDVDKMDYLVRDSYYAGVAYGVTDVERLIHTIILEKNDIVVDEGGTVAVESLLINRSMMYETVYRHHTKRIAEAMMLSAMKNMILGGLDVKQLIEWDDLDLFTKMRSSTGYVKDMIDRIDQRRLFKNVFREPVSNFDEETRAGIEKNPDVKAKEIAQRLGIDPNYLILDYPEMSMSEYRVKIKANGKHKMINEISSLAKSLESAEREKLYVNIYIREKDKKTFQDFKAEDFFGYEQKKISGYI